MIDTAEFLALAKAADVDPAKMAAAFNDPIHLLEHITAAELEQIRQSCTRFAAVQDKMAAALGEFAAYGRGFLAGRSAKD